MEGQVGRLDTALRAKFQRLLLFSTALIVCVLYQVFFWHDTTDDAYIFFRYSWRFAHGLGLTFNNGERVEGFSSPLWTLILSGSSALGIMDLSLFAHLVGLLLLLVVLLLVYDLLRRFDADSIFAFSVATAMLLITPGFHYYLGSGLETGLLMALLLLAFWLIATGRSTFASGVLGVVAITRPEGILYAVAWMIWCWKNRTVRLHQLLVCVAPAIAWEGFRILYYHSIIPNTALAKPWTGMHGLGVLYAGRFSLPLITVAALYLTLRDRDIVLPAAVRFAPWMLIAAYLFVAYAQGDWMLFGRFLVPIAPIAAVGSAVLLSFKISKPMSRAATVAILTVVQVACWYGTVTRYVHNDGFAFLMRGTDALQAGQWIHDHTPPRSTIATARLGGIAWKNLDRTVWDFAGLTDYAAAEYIARGSMGTNPVQTRYPEIIAEASVPADWSYTNDREYVVFLNNKYVLLSRIPQGNFGTMDVWERRDIFRNSTP